LIADTFELAMEKMKIFFQDVENLRAIYMVVSQGIGLKYRADNLDIPHRYKNLIWQDGEAVEKKFDIRGLFHFVLLAEDRSVDSKIKEVLRPTSCHNLIKEFISEPDIRPTKVRYYDHNTWKKGPELFNTLKKYVEGK